MSYEFNENSINEAALDALIAAHDGDMALLYLYFCRYGSIEPEDAALRLCMTSAQLSAAEEKLQRLSLLSPGSPCPAAPHSSKAPARQRKCAPPQTEPDTLIPDYTSAEVVRRTRDDGVFSGLLEECSKVIGHSLSSADIKMLFGIYDYLSLPPEVIMELLNYCAELCSEKFGAGRRPSMRLIEKQAYSWARLEILTLEQAEHYIKKQRDRRGRTASVAQLLGIRDRHLSPSEARYIGSWLDMGFGEEAISIAYDRTVTSTGSLKWAYMNKILQNWDQHKLHTPEEIEENDSRRPKSLSPASGQKSVDIEALRDAVSKI